MRSAPILFASALVTLAACGGASDGSANPEPSTADTAPPTTVEASAPVEEAVVEEPAVEEVVEVVPFDFCTELEASSGALGNDSDLEPDEVAARLEALAERAPDDIADSLTVIANLVTQIADVEEAANDDDGEGNGEEMIELLFSDEVLEASEALDEYSTDVCGFDPDDTATATIDDSDTTDEEADDIDDGFTEFEPIETDTETDTETDDETEPANTTVPGDPYDEEFWGPIRDDEISFPGADQYLDVVHAGSGWFEAQRGWAFGGTFFEMTASSRIIDEGEELCNALLDYTSAIDPIVGVRIEFEDDDGTIDPVAYVGSVDEPCSPDR